MMFVGLSPLAVTVSEQYHRCDDMFSWREGLSWRGASVSADTDGLLLCSLLLSEERDPAPPTLGHVQPQALSHRELLHRLQPHVATATAPAGQVGHPAGVYLSNAYVNLRTADSNAKALISLSSLYSCRHWAEWLFSVVLVVCIYANTTAIR